MVLGFALIAFGVDSGHGSHFVESRIQRELISDSQKQMNTGDGAEELEVVALARDKPLLEVFGTVSKVEDGELFLLR